MPRVLVLGASGMAGSMIASTLPGAVAVGRTDFEATRDDPATLFASTGAEWVINAIGVIGARIDAGSVERAITVNARFPHALAGAAGAHGARVIHLTTDGVFDGRRGAYAEDHPHDATGVYARSKSDGEVTAPHVLNLRCSIVGPERPPGRSLLSWLLAQPTGARLTGYANHRWNGLTTLALARVCAGIVRERPELPGTLHVVPADAVSKADLIGMLAVAYRRGDLVIDRGEAPTAVDRSLDTLYPESNELIWRAAGYPAPPTVAAMVRELATTTAREQCATSPSSSASART
jgi:dTDP-4-dehydrorhamnose reductase